MVMSAAQTLRSPGESRTVGGAHRALELPWLEACIVLS
jgi:hypothetical protein